ncbi:TPA: TonB family protein [Pseudomonas putida]|nr:TonB family protein [Pseudomonas putida]
MNTRIIAPVACAVFLLLGYLAFKFAADASLTEPQPPRRWMDKVIDRITEEKAYPEEAKLKGLEGVVTVRFMVNAKGEIGKKEATLVSGDEVFRQAALSMFDKLSERPLPPPPEFLLNNGKFEVVAPIVYCLRNSPCDSNYEADAGAPH